jgi:cyclophilin family peptidyl-prolyl cis-trans isomerase
MRIKRILVAAAAAALLTGATAPVALSQGAGPAAEWRTVAPENLLIIDTAKGRILIEMDPRVAPVSVERVRTLADQGFYDGLKFHRVLRDFMAQTGDPLGTGEGGSQLPDIQAEFTFRRGRSDGFVSAGGGGSGPLTGLVGSMPVRTQPDAQMMITADMKVPAQGLFCPGVVGMARANEPNSANSQFFIMTAANDNLNGAYTPFGRVVGGLDVVRSLKEGPESANGAVTDPDVMTRARTAAALPEGQRPSVRVRATNSPAFAAQIAEAQTRLGTRFSACDVQPTAEVTGG